MRGGAIPMLAWGTVLLVLAIGNWIWDAKTVNGLAATAAVLIVYVFGIVLWLRRREAVRRGPPEPTPEPDAVPLASIGAAGVGVSLGCILFGVAWAKFLVDFGIGLMILSLGRLAIEMRYERRSRVESLRGRARQ